MRELLLKALTAASLTLAVASFASAADLPRKAPAVVPAPAVYNWSGFYVGGHGGYGWGGNANWDSDFNCGVRINCEQLSQDPKGWVAGLQGGYRWQFGQWVVGIEGSYSWSHIRTTDPSPCTPGVNTCIGIPAFAVNEEIQIRNIGTVTGQVGYAWDRLLWYAKGGWATGEIRRNTVGDVLVGPAARCSSRVTQRDNAGWTAGTGLEYAFWDNFSIGIEYNYIHLGVDSYRVRALSTGGGNFETNASGV